jgi:polyisoprenoid-binding protein YceI
VIGAFNDFDAAIHLDRANPAKSSVEFTIQATSIDTNNENRDKHLRSGTSSTWRSSGDYVKSTAIAPKEGRVRVTGELTMHGVTKAVTLPVQFLGAGKDPWGNEKMGFELSTTLDRKDYGIVWNKALDQGGFLLGDEVWVTLEIEAVREKVAS